MSQSGTISGNVPDIRPAGPPTQLTTVTTAEGPQVVEYSPQRGGAGQGSIRTVIPKAVKGTVPPIPEATQREIVGLGTGASSLEQLREILPRVKVGPFWGRLRNVQMAYLGGWGATPEEVEAATQINMLMRSAFDTAGANFTEPEMRIFRSIYPQQTDTLETALTKIPASLRYIQKRLELRKGVMSPMQREQATFPEVNVTPSGTQGAIPQPQGGANQGGAAPTMGSEVTVKAPNGKTYVFPNQQEANKFKQAAGIK
jgi:hypothetical protein